MRARHGSGGAGSCPVVRAAGRPERPARSDGAFLTLVDSESGTATTRAARLLLLREGKASEEETRRRRRTTAAARIHSQGGLVTGVRGGCGRCRPEPLHGTLRHGHLGEVPFLTAQRAVRGESGNHARSAAPPSGVCGFTCPRAGLQNPAGQRSGLAFRPRPDRKWIPRPRKPVPCGVVWRRVTSRPPPPPPPSQELLKCCGIAVLTVASCQPRPRPDSVPPLLPRSTDPSSIRRKVRERELGGGRASLALSDVLHKKKWNIPDPDEMEGRSEGPSQVLGDMLVVWTTEVILESLPACVTAPAPPLTSGLLLLPHPHGLPASRLPRLPACVTELSPPLTSPHLPACRHHSTFSDITAPSTFLPANVTAPPLTSHLPPPPSF
ncbi:uncharacterized protein LOC116574984 [Mustela erminea]|uniref:uncharacterized protein LOC116574984 n=1 Tax=Mustela erminea TaxID=36723 RepID=UPI00138715B7|nr:uncharacterized protein LOC116574984 [Mustela erminea]